MAGDPLDDIRGTPDASSLPLGVLYSRSAAIHEHLDRIVGSKDPHLVSKALEICQNCERVVESQGIFSANEDQEDLSTSDMRYLLAPYHTAELLSSSPVASPSQRLEQVQAAERGYSRFLHRLDQYKLLGDLGSKMYKHEEEHGALDPNTKRMLKIEKFKQDKNINAQLCLMQQQRDAAAHKEEVRNSHGMPYNTCM